MQRGAFNELHGDVENSVLLAGVIDGYDVGMVQDARSASLILETAHHFLRVQTMDVEPHRFKRYGPPDRRVQRLVHNAHGAATKLTGNLVSANRLNRHHEGLLCDSVAPLLVLGKFLLRQFFWRTHTPSDPKISHSVTPGQCSPTLGM